MATSQMFARLEANAESLVTDALDALGLNDKSGSEELFEVVVSDGLDPDMYADHIYQPYYTVALNLNPKFCPVLYRKRDVSDLVKRKKLSVGDPLTAAEETLFNQWKTYQLSKQRKEAVDAEEARLKKKQGDRPLRMTKKIREAHEAAINAVKQRQDEIGPKYNNIVKLRFTEFMPDSARRESNKLAGAVLDSFYYYTHPKAIDVLKTFGKSEVEITSGQKNNLMALFKAVEKFVYKTIGVHFMALFDGWTGFYKPSNDYVTSDSLSDAARRHFRGTLAKSGYLRDLFDHYMQGSPADQHRETKRALMADNGFYSSNGFIRQDILRAHDSYLRDHPAIKFALLLAQFGANPEYYYDLKKLMVAFPPVSVDLSVVPKSGAPRRKIIETSLHSSPVKVTKRVFVLGDAVPLTVGEHNVKKSKELSLYDMCEEPESIFRLITKKAPLAVTVREAEPVPERQTLNFSPDAGLRPRRSSRKRPRSFDAAFMDLTL